MPDAALGRSEAGFVVDVALGVAGETVGAAAALLRKASRWPPLRSRRVWRPAHVPSRLQPASVATDLSQRGAHYREWASEHLDRLLDQWTPLIVEMVVSRLDLTSLVTRHVDLDRVVSEVDLDAVVARVDLDAAVARVDLDAIVGRVDLDAAVNGVDIDAIVQRLDIDGVLDRVDVVAIAEETIAAIDLPEIIRESTGSIASETVRGTRMTGISLDEAISRSIQRHLFRRPPPGTPTTSTTPSQESP
jgi:hypothetical protein